MCDRTSRFHIYPVLHPMRIQRLSDAEYRQLLLMRALMLVWFVILLGGFS